MCQCPPDYRVNPLPVDCGCCSAGYTFVGPTLNYPNGYCTGAGGAIVEPIECNPCVDTLSAKCVILPDVPCFGITAGTSLYEFISSYMCSDAFVMGIINRISLSSTLQAAMCSVMSTCPPAGSSTPIWSGGSVTVP